eukprot:m.20935 g.20935  ORF g.20935 m.20935 type:complete len:1905 (-) comp12269_c0_seq4:275-5989(-)
MNDFFATIDGEFLQVSLHLDLHSNETEDLLNLFHQVDQTMSHCKPELQAYFFERPQATQLILEAVHHMCTAFNLDALAVGLQREPMFISRARVLQTNIANAVLFLQGSNVADVALASFEASLSTFTQLIMQIDDISFHRQLLQTSFSGSLAKKIRCIFTTAARTSRNGGNQELRQFLAEQNIQVSEEEFLRKVQDCYRKDLKHQYDPLNKNNVHGTCMSICHALKQELSALLSIVSNSDYEFPRENIELTRLLRAIEKTVHPGHDSQAAHGDWCVICNRQGTSFDDICVTVLHKMNHSASDESFYQYDCDVCSYIRQCHQQAQPDGETIIEGYPISFLDRIASEFHEADIKAVLSAMHPRDLMVFTGTGSISLESQVQQTPISSVSSECCIKYSQTYTACVEGRQAEVLATMCMVLLLSRDMQVRVMEAMNMHRIASQRLTCDLQRSTVSAAPSNNDGWRFLWTFIITHVGGEEAHHASHGACIDDSDVHAGVQTVLSGAVAMHKRLTCTEALLTDTAAARDPMSAHSERTSYMGCGKEAVAGASGDTNRVKRTRSADGTSTHSAARMEEDTHVTDATATFCTSGMGQDFGNMQPTDETAASGELEDIEGTCGVILEARKQHHYIAKIDVVSVLQGSVLVEAMRCFEDAVGKYVKEQMQRHFGCDRINATGNSDNGENAIDPRDSSTSSASAAPTSLKPTSIWLQKCQKVQPPSEDELTEHGEWNTLVLVTVISGYGKDIFTDLLHDTDDANSVHKLREMVSHIRRTVVQRNQRHAEGRMVVMSPMDVLHAIHHMHTIAVGCSAAGGDVSNFCLEVLEQLENDARFWVGHVQELPAGNVQLIEKTIDVNTYNVLALFENMRRLEALLCRAIGSFKYQNNTIEFDKLSEVRKRKIRKIVPFLKCIYDAHFWFCHRTLRTPDFADIDVAMRAITACMRTCANEPLDEITLHRFKTDLSTERTEQVLVDVEVTSLASRMKIPMARTTALVGRKAVIEDLVAALADPGKAPRILVHGIPGVGKDVVVAEVVHHPRIQSLNGLQLWIQATTDALFQRQMLDAFRTHRPDVVRGFECDTNEGIRLIRSWLARTPDWVIVLEDVPSDACWSVLPREEHGRVIMTSQMPLRESNLDFRSLTKVVKLEPMSVDECLDILRLEKIFSVSDADAHFASIRNNDMEIVRLCETTDVTVPQRLVGDGQHLQPHERSTLLQEVYTVLELRRPELKTFLIERLGLLPLSVSLCARMVRSTVSIRSVPDLIQNVQDKPITQVHDPSGDYHAGSDVSIDVMINRLFSGVKNGHSVFAMAVVLSLLDRANTPLGLLLGHDVPAMSAMIAQYLTPHTDAAGDKHDSRDMVEGVTCVLSVFATKRTLLAACNTANEYGVLQREKGDETSVGVMHQIVKRYILEYAVEKAQVTLQICICFVSEVIRERLDVFTTYCSDSASRNVVTCASAYCDSLKNLRVTTEPIIQVICDIHETLVNVLVEFECNARAAHEIALLSFEFHKTYLPSNHLNLAKPMGKLGTTCHELGWHEKALAWREDTLKYRMRTLEPTHPNIAASMGNLALTHSAQGHFKVAVSLQEKALAIFRSQQASTVTDSNARLNMIRAIANLASTYCMLGRFQEAFELKKEALGRAKQILQADDLFVATLMSNLASTHASLDNYPAALELHQQALAIRERVLPANHKYIASSKGNLATMLNAVGRHEEALVLMLKTLELHERLLPPDHPDIATCMGFLASIHEDLGEHTEALQLRLKTLALHQKLLPRDHPTIATSMDKLASTYGELGMHTEALCLGEEALALRQRVLPPEHQHIAASMGNLAGTCHAMGNRSRAQSLQQRALAILQDALPEGHSEITKAKRNLEVSSSLYMAAVEGDCMPHAITKHRSTYCPVGTYNDATEMGRDFP